VRRTEYETFDDFVWIVSVPEDKWATLFEDLLSESLDFARHQHRNALLRALADDLENNDESVSS
jgi:hypothetical protein